MKRNETRNGLRRCPQCGEEFQASGECKSYAQRFCSRRCARQNRSDHVRVGWPTREEMIAMVRDEKLSDSVIGKRYGHSYEWGRRVRNAYGIPAEPKPPHRTVKHGRYIGRGNWTIANKGETRCRNCGAQPHGRGPLGALHLHHVIPRSMCKAIATDLRNGIPLCHRCHSGWHERTVVISRSVFTVEEWSFLCAAPVIGQNVVAWLEDNYPAVDVAKIVREFVRS